MSRKRRLHGGLLLKISHYLKDAISSGRTELTVSEMAKTLDELEDSVRKVIKRRFEESILIKRTGGAGYTLQEGGGAQLDKMLAELVPNLPLEAAGRRLLCALNRLARPAGAELDVSERALLLQVAADEIRSGLPPGSEPVETSPGVRIGRQGLLAWLMLEDAIQDLLLGQIDKLSRHLTGGAARLLDCRHGGEQAGRAEEVSFCDDRFHGIMRRLEAGASDRIGGIADLVSDLPNQVESILRKRIPAPPPCPDSWQQHCKLVAHTLSRDVSGLIVTPSEIPIPVLISQDEQLEQVARRLQEQEQQLTAMQSQLDQVLGLLQRQQQQRRARVSILPGAASDAVEGRMKEGLSPDSPSGRSTQAA